MDGALARAVETRPTGRLDASPDHYEERNTTRPAHRDAVSQRPARGGDGACKTAALGDALHVMIGNIHDRVRTLRGRVPDSPESTTARRPSALRSAPSPSWKIIAHLVIHFNKPNKPAPRPPIKPQLAARKTLAQQAGQCCSPERGPQLHRSIRSAAKISSLISALKSYQHHEALGSTLRS